MSEQIYFDADYFGAPDHFDPHRWPLQGRLIMQVNGRIGQSLYFTGGYFPTYEQAREIADAFNLSIYKSALEQVIEAAQAYGRWQGRKKVAPEYSPGSQRQEGFHWREGWYFERQPDGGVIVSQNKLNIALAIPPTEWASIVASMSAAGETAETFQAALAAQTDTSLLTETPLRERPGT